MSLLTIVQDACRELSLPLLTAVVGNESSNAPMMLRLAKEELVSLAGRAEWTRLTKLHTFTAVAATNQLTASAFPSDFDRMINDTFFNFTAKRKIFGPISAEQYREIRDLGVTPVDYQYRFRGDTILIVPEPTAGDLLNFEYISNQKARSSAGDDQVTWQTDEDTCFIRESLVTNGIIWRYKKSKGYAYSADMEVYERRVAELIMRDGSKPRISTDARSSGRHPAPPETPYTLEF